MKRPAAHPYVLLTAASLFWAGNLVIGRSVRGDVPPIALAFWRWGIALACVLPLAAPHWRAQWPILRRHAGIVALLGALGIAGYNTLAYIALQHTRATSATMLNSFVPIATIGLSFLFFGRRLTRAEALGVAVSLCGVMVLISQGSLATLLGLHFNQGDVWMLAAVMTWGLYTALLPSRPTGVEPTLLLAAFMVVGLAVLAPLYAWELSTGRAMHVSAASMAAIAYAGIVPGFLGYMFYNAGIAAVGPARGSLFLHLIPVFVTVLSALVLDERPEGYHGVGIGLVLIGIYATTRTR